MTGKSYGSTWRETFTGLNPVTGSVPTSSERGQPLVGLDFITVALQAAPGRTLSGTGSLNCYVRDPAFVEFSGSALLHSASYASPFNGTASLVFEGQGTYGFGVGQTLTGVTSGGSGVISSITTGSAGSGSGSLEIISWNSSSFTLHEGLTSDPVSSPWAREPAGDMTVTLVGVQTQVFAPLEVTTYKNEEVKWVPYGVVTSATGSQGVTVIQKGQIEASSRKV